MSRLKVVLAAGALVCVAIMSMAARSATADQVVVTNFNQPAPAVAPRQYKVRKAAEKRSPMGMNLSPACFIPVAGSLVCMGVIDANVQGF